VLHDTVLEELHDWAPAVGGCSVCTCWLQQAALAACRQMRQTCCWLLLAAAGCCWLSCMAHLHRLIVFVLQGCLCWRHPALPCCCGHHQLVPSKALDHSLDPSSFWVCHPHCCAFMVHRVVGPHAELLCHDLVLLPVPLCFQRQDEQTINHIV
jgi:hypothetical protein